ncbi:unnamed protein product, partial [Urochloa humidicola]
YWVSWKNSATDKYSSVKKILYKCIQNTCEGAKECMSRKVPGALVGSGLVALHAIVFLQAVVEYLFVTDRTGR